MKKEKNNSSSYFELFLLTGNILFETISLFTRRTGVDLTLDNLTNETSLSLNN